MKTRQQTSDVTYFHSVGVYRSAYINANHVRLNKKAEKPEKLLRLFDSQAIQKINRLAICIRQKEQRETILQISRFIICEKIAKYMYYCLYCIVLSHLCQPLYQ